MTRLDMTVFFIHALNILKGREGYISKMTQDAKLGDMLNVAVCRGRGKGEKITMTQTANCDHMFYVLRVGSPNCKFQIWLKKPIL